MKKAKRFDFPAWATKQGLPQATIDELCGFGKPGPPPMIYSLAGIRDLHDGNEMGISPAEYGFMIVGGCPNGDPIAIDMRDDLGSVWYLDHGEMHSASLRSVAIRVADNVRALVDGIGGDDDFPIDYYDAKAQRD